MIVCVAAHLLVASSYRAGAQDLPATYFAPKAQAIADGATPYLQVPYEYPPATPLTQKREPVSAASAPSPSPARDAVAPTPSGIRF